MFSTWKHSPACIVFLLLTLFGALPQAHAIHFDGLAINAAGDTVAVGGDNRCIMLLDADTLAVKNRIWNGAEIKKLGFSADGSKLAIFEGGRRIRLLNLTDGSFSKPMEDVERAVFAENRETLAVVVRQRGGYELLLLKTSDLKQISAITPPDNFRIDGIGLNFDATRLAVFSEPRENDEERVSAGEIPGNLSSFAKDVFKENHDGRGCRILLYDTKSGDTLSDHALPWVCKHDQTRVLIQDDTLHCVTYSDLNATIKTADGSVDYFEMNRFGYGLGVSSKANLLISGGLRTGNILNLATNQTHAFEIEALPGWPEYFANFAVSDDGVIYGSTSAFRVVKMNATGKILAVAPVF
ncbi:hypothetical protein JXA32_00310 [Candidatus Sumerlaeota bacterium]|nr:hypothetical protein [Candidatus Sumerlaeota bacterium]